MTDKPETTSRRKPRRPSKGSEADPEQYARFVEAARELECDDDPAAFERMFERVVPPKRRLEEPATAEAATAEAATAEAASEKRKRRPR
jgi:hypothetical protein